GVVGAPGCAGPRHQVGGGTGHEGADGVSATMRGLPFDLEHAVRGEQLDEVVEATAVDAMRVGGDRLADRLASFELPGLHHVSLAPASLGCPPGGSAWRCERRSWWTTRAGAPAGSSSGPAPPGRPGSTACSSATPTPRLSPTTRTRRSSAVSSPSGATGRSARSSSSPCGTPYSSPS